MALSGQDWRRHQSHRQHRNHRTQGNHQKLISTATLTLFVLFLSSWIAYAAGKATVPAPLVEGETESATSQDFNSSSANLCKLLFV